MHSKHKINIYLVGIPHRGLDKSEVENYLSIFPYILFQGFISMIFKLFENERNQRLRSHHVTPIKLSTNEFYLSRNLL